MGSVDVGVDERERGIWDSRDDVVGTVVTEGGRDDESMGTVDAVEEKKDEAVEVVEALVAPGCGCAMVEVAVLTAADGSGGAAEAPGPLLGRKSLFVVGDVGACIVGVFDIDLDERAIGAGEVLVAVVRE